MGGGEGVRTKFLKIKRRLLNAKTVYWIQIPILELSNRLEDKSLTELFWIWVSIETGKKKLTKVVERIKKEMSKSV